MQTPFLQNDLLKAIKNVSKQGKNVKKKVLGSPK
jgi:hypothetical protein